MQIIRVRDDTNITDDVLEYKAVIVFSIFNVCLGEDEKESLRFITFSLKEAQI